MTKPQSVEDYLAQATPEARAALKKVRGQIRTAIPDSEECLSYNMPAFKWQGKAVAGYAAFKKHYSYFHCSGAELDNLPPEFRRFFAGKGIFKFDYNESVPSALVEWLVAARKQEIEAKK